MARERIGAVAAGTENEVAVTVLTGDTSDRTRILLTDGDGDPLGIHTRDQARELRAVLDTAIARSVGTEAGSPLDGWDVTTEGYVRGPGAALSIPAVLDRARVSRPCGPMRSSRGFAATLGLPDPGRAVS